MGSVLIKEGIIHFAAQKLISEDPQHFAAANSKMLTSAQMLACLSVRLALEFQYMYDHPSHTNYLDKELEQIQNHL